MCDNPGMDEDAEPAGQGDTIPAFQERLTSLIGLLGLRPTDLARMMTEAGHPISENHVYKWLRGQSEPKWRHVVAVANVTDTDVRYFADAQFTLPGQEKRYTRRARMTQRPTDPE